MGTRADFYLGRGLKAEWLGSIAFDGYPEKPGVLEGGDSGLLNCKTAEEFKANVLALLGARDDASLPEHGWPWPWDDGRLTDFSYAWEDGTLYVSNYGHGWRTAEDIFRWAEEGGDDPDELWNYDEGKVEFPDMKQQQSVTLGKRSGLIVGGATANA